MPEMVRRNPYLISWIMLHVEEWKLIWLCLCVGSSIAGTGRLVVNERIQRKFWCFNLTNSFFTTEMNRPVFLWTVWRHLDILYVGLLSGTVAIRLFFGCLDKVRGRRQYYFNAKFRTVFFQVCSLLRLIIDYSYVTGSLTLWEFFFLQAALSLWSMPRSAQSLSN